MRRHKGSRNRARYGHDGPDTRTRSEKSLETSPWHLRGWALAWPADAPRYRAEIDIFEIRLGRLEIGSRRRIAVNMGNGTSRIELRRDHGVSPFEFRQSFRRRHASPNPALQLRDSLQGFRF